LLKESELVSLASRRVLERKFGDDNEVVGEEGVRLVDVGLELREGGAIPMDVDVIVITGTSTSFYHALHPGEALSSGGGRADCGKRLLDGEGVDVVQVPLRGGLRGDRRLGLIRLVQREQRRESELLLARREVCDGGRVAVRATLHSNEIEPAVAVVGWGGVCLVVINEINGSLAIVQQCGIQRRVVPGPAEAALAWSEAFRSGSRQSSGSRQRRRGKGERHESGKEGLHGESITGR